MHPLCPNIFLLILAIISMSWYNVCVQVQGFTALSPSHTHNCQRKFCERSCTTSSLRIFGDGDDNDMSGSTMDPVLEIPLLEAKLAAANAVEVEADIVVNEDLVQELKQKIGDAKTAAEFGVRR
eukprot:148754_1